jgi:hypothetical protein
MSIRTSLFAFATLAALTATADAKPRRLVVLDFDGPRSLADTGRDAVVQVLGEQYDVVAKKRWEDARARAQQKSAGPSTWAKAAKASGVDAVIGGFISDDGRHKQLTISITEAESGTELDQVTVRLDNKGLTSNNRTKLGEELDEVLAYVDGAAEPIDDGLQVIETRKMLGAKKQLNDDGVPIDDDQPVKRKKHKKHHARAEQEEVAVESEPSDDGETISDEDDADEAPAPKKQVAVADPKNDNTDLVTLFGATSEEGKVVDPSASHTPVPTPRFHIDAGFFYASRSLNFGAENQTGPLPYSAPTKGLQINAAFYPFPREKYDGGLSGIGFTATVSKSTGSTVTFDDGDTVGEYSIDQSSYDIGIHYRYPLTQLVTIDGGASYGRNSYVFPDVPEAFEIPDTNYSYLGAGGKLDLNISNRATVGFGFRYMYLLDTGDITSVDWYGPGRASGYGLNADFSIPLPSNLYVRGAVAWEKYSIDFDGAGVITDDEGVYESKDSTITGALDVGIGF